MMLGGLKMNICFVNRMKKIMATSTRISANSEIEARGLSQISYISILTRSE